MTALDWTAALVLAVTGTTLALLIPFALHRLLLLRAARGRSGSAPRVEWTGDLPRVTIQLPLYNEAPVVERLLDAVGDLEYPADRLEIQILDDSTDETRVRVARKAAELERDGLEVHHLHRTRREGFKAGALEAGRRSATGEFLLVLDADFVPDPGLIRRLLPDFRDPRVGMVQARWDHLNENASWLTRCQALLLDAHFFFEQGGRHAAGRFINFNGTAGMWRATALHDAGGWSADTLTEDLDVSYRAQLAGWRFVYRGDLGVPAELPTTVPALERQQQRWAQGGIQTARKLLGRLWRAELPLGTRLEGTVHLLGHLAHPLTVLLGVLIVPSAVARRQLGLDSLLPLDLLVFGIATGSFLVFYTLAGRCRSRPVGPMLLRGGITLALGIGLTAPVSRSVLRGLRRGASDPFRRTPKTGQVLVGIRGGESAARTPAVPPMGVVYPVRSGRPEQWLKAALTLWVAAMSVVAVGAGLWASLPLLGLFGAGWGWLAIAGAGDGRADPGRAGGEAPAAATGWAEPIEPVGSS